MGGCTKSKLLKTMSNLRSRMNRTAITWSSKRSRASGVDTQHRKRLDVGQQQSFRPGMSRGDFDTERVPAGVLQAAVNEGPACFAQQITRPLQ